MNKTAILYFSLSHKAECKNKQLFRNQEVNHSFQAHLKSNLNERIKATQLPCFHSNESNQVGLTFGDRLYHALSETFLKGYEKVIVVGSDVPDLSSEDILKAKQLLTTNNVVLGPDKRGGTYLIGIDKETFNDDFKNLAWQSTHLIQDLERYALALNAALAHLAKRSDLNFRFEVAQLLPYSHLLRSILKRLVKRIFVAQRRVVFPKFQIVSLQELRGPPSVARLFCSC